MGSPVRGLPGNGKDPSESAGPQEAKVLWAKGKVAAREDTSPDLRKLIQRFPVDGVAKNHTLSHTHALITEGISYKHPLSPESTMPHPKRAGQVRPSCPSHLLSPMWGREDKKGEWGRGEV